ncbi:hypothetical protein N9X64_00015 [bacterium]|nr:hypothetical protein [bacterium]
MPPKHSPYRRWNRMKFRLPRGMNIEGEHLKLAQRVKKLERTILELQKTQKELLERINEMEGPQ